MEKMGGCRDIRDKKIRKALGVKKRIFFEQLGSVG
jgi:hypothetical protein